MLKRILFAFTAVVAVATPISLAAAPTQAATTTTPTITKFNQNVDTIYPTVRDGFRDSVTFTGDAQNLRDESNHNVRQTWNITVRNANGRKIASHDGTLRTWDNIRWTWNTKNQSTSTPVPTGKYKATLTVTNDETGETDTAATTLHATSDTVNRRITKSRTGVDTSARTRTHSCYIDRDWGTSHLSLDCWGGRQAVARYGFTLPRDARNLTWGMRGERGCCSDGRVIKTGTRPSATHYDVRVKVTNWAAYTVHRASITYTTKIHR